MLPTLKFDHLHLYVTNRDAAEQWYADVLGCKRQPELVFWATEGGPLTLADASGNIHLALFERAPQPCRSTIAFAVGAPDLLRWRDHLQSALASELKIFDHTVSWSIYFSDPDGNPFEITTYEYAQLQALQAG